MRFRDMGSLQPAVGGRYLGSQLQPMVVSERQRRMNEGPNFRMPEVSDGEPAPSMTMRRMSETLQRDPSDFEPVSTMIDGGALGAIMELERQAQAFKAERQAEAEELATDAGEATEQDAQKLFLQSVLMDDPGLVLELVIEFLKSKSDQS